MGKIFGMKTYTLKEQGQKGSNISKTIVAAQQNACGAYKTWFEDIKFLKTILKD